MSPASYLLAIDVGNTQTVIGLFDGEEIRASWRLGSVARWTSDELAILIEGLFRLSDLKMSAVKRVVISSVVPQLGPTLEEMSVRYFGVSPWWSDRAQKRVFRSNTTTPTTSAQTASSTLSPGFTPTEGRSSSSISAPLSRSTPSRLRGVPGRGDIPGFGVALEALIERAARLPRIEPATPESVIGKNTVHSIQSGMFFGYKGLINGIVSHMKAELGGAAKVVATGGQSLLFGGGEEIFDHVDPDLTLVGLRLVAERNP